MTGPASATRAHTFLTGAGDRPAPAGSLRGIDLDALEARAALQTRVDVKYLVPADVHVRFLDAFGDRLRVLDIDGVRRFTYRSVYFDSPGLWCHRAHVQRRRDRFKIRTRTYVDSGRCVLEVKRKGSRSETVKKRRTHPVDAADRLTVPGRAFVAELIPSVTAVSLQPSLETRYARTTLLDVPSTSRVTCDTDLVFERGRAHAAMIDGVVLIETKSADGAGPVDRWLWVNRVRPVSISKYCVGVAMLHPGATHNPWHRLVRRWFVRRPDRPADVAEPADAAIGT